MLGRAAFALIAVAALASANGCCYCHSNDSCMLNCGFMGCQACDCKHDCLRNIFGCCNRCDSCGGCGGCGSCGGGCSSCGGGCDDGCGCNSSCWCGGSRYPNMGCCGICWDGYDDCGCDPCDRCGNWVGGGCSSCGGHGQYGGGYSEGWSDDEYAGNMRGHRSGTTVASRQGPPPKQQYVSKQRQSPEMVAESERFTGRPKYATATKTKSVVQQPTMAQNRGKDINYTARPAADDPRY